MKKLGLIVAALLSVTGASQAAVQIQLDAGVLRTFGGTSTLTNGMLLQLIAVRTGANGTFATPTSNSFLGGDTTNELVIASFAFNQGGSGYVTGETDNTITFSLENTGAAGTTTFDAGDALLLRWYPGLTLASTAPGIGATYGQYRSNTGEVGGIAWFAPGDGTVLTVPGGLNFLTVAAGGPNPNTAGYANSIVTPVPEPATLSILGVALMGLGGLYLRRRSK